MRAWGVDAAEPIVADAAALRSELCGADWSDRQDRHRRIRRSPIIMGSLLAIAAIGAALLCFAAREDAFAGGGQTADAPASVDGAAVSTREALETAERLQQQGVRIRNASASTRGAMN